jgi:hypothetical protein
MILPSLHSQCCTIDFANKQLIVKPIQEHISLNTTSLAFSMVEKMGLPMT